MSDFASRQQRYQKLHAHLAQLSDTEVMQACAPARVSTLTFAQEPVLVKRIALTELEREPEHYLSTANLFALPECYHYALGSRGFSAWRELTAQQLASEWVLSQQCESFPLLYHWRVCQRAPNASHLLTEQQCLQESAFWQDAAIERRLKALQAAQAEIVLFLEYIPQNLMTWCAQALRSEARDASLLWLEAELAQTTQFMQSQGVIHFDAHFENIVTDGTRLYFSDFGLANALQFELSASELAFMQSHTHYDFMFVMLNLMHVIANPDFSTQRQWISLNKQRLPTTILQSSVAVALIDRYWEMASVMDDFFTALFRVSRQIPYPAAILSRLYNSISTRAV